MITSIDDRPYVGAGAVRSYSLGGLLIAIVVIFIAAGARVVLVHDGSHAGPVVTQMNQEAALAHALNVDSNNY